MTPVAPKNRGLNLNIQDQLRDSSFFSHLHHATSSASLLPNGLARRSIHHFPEH
jgi:hypothetical protein